MFQQLLRNMREIKCIKLSEKNRIFKNFLACNLAMVCTYAALGAVGSVQFVLMEDRRLALLAQFVIYVSQLATSFVIPEVMIDLIGVKFGFVFCNLLVLTFIVVQVIPISATLIPTGILAGLGKSGAWTINGYFVTKLSKSYAKLTNTDFSKCQTLFFGFMSAIFYFGFFLAAVLIAVILQPETIPASANMSLISNVTFDYSANCGANNCPNTPLPRSTSKASVLSVYILCGALILLTLIAISIPLIFIDDPPKDDDEEEADQEESENGIKAILRRTGSKFKIEMTNLYKNHLNLNIWLLFVINAYVGFELTLFIFDFGRAFSACLKNVNFIGWAIMFFGVIGSAFSVISTFVLKYTGKSMGITIAICFSLGISIFIISWTPSQEGYYVIFLMLIGFSVAQPITLSQVRGLYGIYFPNTPSAIGSATISLNLGFLIGTYSSIVICMRTKTYIHMGLVVASLISFVVLEVRKNFKKEDQVALVQPNNNPTDPEKPIFKIRL